MTPDYRVKLNNPEDTPSHQQIDGYLAAWGSIMKYTRGQALKKAKVFNGKIEPVDNSKDLEIMNSTKLKEAKVNSLASKTAMDYFISDYGDLSFDEAYEALVDLDYSQSTFVISGLTVWEPFANYCAGDLLELIDNHIDHLKEYLEEYLMKIAIDNT